MFKNYLKIILRGFSKSKAFSFINIAGLSLSLAIVILIALYAQMEFSVNKFHKNYNRIYKIGKNTTPATIYDVIKSNVPAVQQITRIENFRTLSVTMKYNDNILTVKNIIFSDPAFFNIFTFKVVKGDLKTALDEPMMLVLTKSEAKRIFGGENPINKIVKMDNAYELTVKAIIDDIPQNSSIQFGGVISFISIKKMTGNDNFDVFGWGNRNYETFFLAPENLDKASLEKLIIPVIKKNTPETQRDINTELFALHEIYYDADLSSFSSHGSTEKNFTLISIAFLILLIAVINYINLSTARVSARTKEIGIRKTIGASRFKLLSQFLTESVVMSILSMILAVIIASELVKVFNKIIDFRLELFPDMVLLRGLSLFAAAIFLGIIAGIYPAFYFTSFKPDLILKGNIYSSHGKGRLRKGLIILQFSIAVVLVISTLVIYNQMEYIKSRPLGFQKENIIYFTTNNDILQKAELFKSRVVSNSNISDFAYTSSIPGEMGMSWGQDLNYEGKDSKIWFTTVLVSTDFIRFMGMKMALGRNFIDKDKNDEWNAIVNQAFVKKYGLKDPFKARFKGLNNKGAIVGVVKDFNFQSLHSQVEPLVFVNYPDWFSNGMVKIKSSRFKDIKRVITHLKSVWAELSPDFPFEYNFLDERLAIQYKAEDRFEKSFLSFSVLAIFIASLGLFGVSAFVTEQRTKEVGIRKVLGASISEIVLILSKEFLIWIFIANIIAWPVAFYLMKNWLENFAYRINLNWFVFIISGLLALLIALITVGIHAIKAARANPVDSLKYE